MEQDINNHFFHHYDFEIYINLFFTSVKISFLRYLFCPSIYTTNSGKFLQSKELY